MKIRTGLVLSLLLVMLFSGSILAQRKLPAGTYVTTAKIEIVSGDTARYHYAEAMLDSLFQFYGPHAEGLFLMNQMMVDFIERAPNAAAKKPYVKRMVAYLDSLKMACNNKDIKKDFRKDCDKFVGKADSTAVKYWREFYNAGVTELGEVKDIKETLETATDSANIAWNKNRMQALVDTLQINMEMAIMIDSTDHRTYVAVGSLREEQGKYQEANEWLTRAIDFVPKDQKPNILLQISYNFINSGEYCRSIPYFNRYLELAPDDMANLVNLGIVYNRCEKYDSAVTAYRRVLEQDTCNLDALASIGTYFNQQARAANDSATAYRNEDNQKMSDEWLQKRSNILDSSLFYFRRAFKCHPEDVDAIEQYALIAFVQAQYEEAVEAYQQLVKVDPENTEAWLTLGDAYVQLQEFKNAIAPYEKVIEMEPDNADILERLAELYMETGNAEKSKMYRDKLEALKGSAEE